MEEFNSNVKVLQEQLNKLNYTGENGKSLTEDGLYGSETLSAILAYKINNQLYDRETPEYPSVTEDVDIETWQSIFAGTLISPIPNGQDKSRFFSYNPDVHDDKVEKIQNFLRNKGYIGADRELLEVTGYYDFDTCMAVNFFKLDNGIDDDGMIGVVTNEVYDLIFPEEVGIEQKVQHLMQTLNSNSYGILQTLENNAMVKNGKLDSAIWNDYGEIIGYNPNGEGYTIHGEAGTKIQGGDTKADTPLTFATSRNDLELILSDKIMQQLKSRHGVDEQTATRMYNEDVKNQTNRYGTFDGRLLYDNNINKFNGSENLEFIRRAVKEITREREIDATLKADMKEALIAILP